MAIKPLVLVFQELRSPSAQIIDPTLSGCVIGPHIHVRTYAEHHDLIGAGRYDVVNGNTIVSLPDAVAGMKPRADGFKVLLDKARVVIDSGTGGEITTDGVLTGSSGENFLLDGTAVHPGDTVKVTSVLTLTGAASVVVATNNKRINLASLPVGFVVTDEIAVGDTVAISTASYTGTVTAVAASYIDVDVAFGADVTSATIVVTRARFLQDPVNHRPYAVKGPAKDDAGVPIKNVLLLTTNFPFAATGVTYEITRIVNDADVTASATLDTVTGITTLSPSAVVTIDGLDRPVTEYAPPAGSPDMDVDKAYVLIEYTALDVTYAHIPAKISLNTDVAALLGVTDTRNPLGKGAQIMFANGQAVMYAVGLASEDDAGWLGAIDVVNRNKFYAQAILTDDKTIVAAYLANNVANEVPAKAQYGIVVGNHHLPTTVTLAGSSAGAIQLDTATSTKIVFQDTTANFTNPSDPVLPGDVLTVSGVPHKVDVVLNANRLKVLVADEFAALATGVTYTITRALSKDQQAASMAATSTALKNKRAVMTYSNLVEIDGKDEPGYYLNAAVAGMMIGLPSHAGITTKGIAGIDKVKQTNWDYFTDDQLDVLAQGGTLIFVQDDANSLPYVRHQLTTDTSLIETAELSVVKNNDYLALFFKGIVKPYLGTWNVTPELIGALNVALTQGIKFQTGNKVAKLGAPLLSATILELVQSDISPDRVEIRLDTKQPKPLNTIGLHLIV